MKNNKSHTVAESAFCNIVNNVLGEEYEKEILKIPIPDDNISQRLQDMSRDVEPQNIANICRSRFFLPSFFLRSVG
jgi:hypothetical protein